MYKISCNWSDTLETLILSNKVNIDYIKTGIFGEFEEKFTAMRSIKPVLIHGLGYFERSGMKDICAIDFSRVNQIIKECDSPHYGLHLAI